MQSIQTYAEALSAIWDRSGYDKGHISNPFAGDEAAKLGLERTRRLLEQTNHANLPYHIVHIAGSKGKGSVSTMIDAMLRAAGVRTGRYLSPHLHSFRERFVVNDAAIGEQDFIALTREFLTAADEIECSSPEIGSITAFELSTAMAFAWFAKQQCEVAVIEVGLGGLLDSTNIITPTVSVITTLDYEHTAILGSSMAEIAMNKAGIIKESRPVLTAVQPDEAMGMIRETAEESRAPLLVEARDWDVAGNYHAFEYTESDFRIDELKLSLVGDHQVHNAGLAIATVRKLESEAAKLNLSEKAVRVGLKSAKIPARFESMQMEGGGIVVIDGAHTPASANALVSALAHEYPDANVTFVLGMLADKDIAGTLAPILEMDADIIVTTPNNPRSVPAAELLELIAETGHQATSASDVAAALESSRRHGGVIVVTGSFSTAADAQLALNLAELGDPPP